MATWPLRKCFAVVTKYSTCSVVAVDFVAVAVAGVVVVVAVVPLAVVLAVGQQTELFRPLLCYERR